MGITRPLLLLGGAQAAQAAGRLIRKALARIRAFRRTCDRQSRVPARLDEAYSAQRPHHTAAWPVQHGSVGALWPCKCIDTASEPSMHGHRLSSRRAATTIGGDKVDFESRTTPFS